MRSLMFAFGAAFTLVGVVSSGCGSTENCAKTPSHPEAQAPLGNLRFYGSDAMNNELPLPVVPESGTLEVTGEEVLIQYRQGDVDYRVVYRVAGAR